MTNYAKIVTQATQFMNKINAAVIGTGYLGKYHVDKYATLPASRLVAICDIDSENTQELSEKYRLKTTENYRDLLGQVNAVSIATPTSSHFEIAEFFLKNKVHVFIEKPITTTLQEADTLVTLAEKNKLILQVGHIERFNPAFRFIEPLVHHTRFIEAQRLTSFKLRGSDVSVILDMMIHDIDIVLSLVKSSITDIRATGASVLTHHIDIANARLEFESGCVASITASRINPTSARLLRIFQDENHLHVDLHRNLCRIRRKGNSEMYPGVPTIDSEETYLEKGDALKEEIKAFLNAVIHNTTPTVSGQAARDALAIAMQITQIITDNNAKHQQ